LEPDRSALTESNFELLGLKLPTQTGNGGDTLIGGGANDVVTTTDKYPWFDISKLGTTPDSKARYYNALLSAGYTEADILAAAKAKIPGGIGTDAQWKELTDLALKLRTQTKIDEVIDDKKETIDQYAWFDPTKFSSTDATSKARYYNLLRSAGYTDAQIMAAANAKLPGGIGSPDQFRELQQIAYDLRYPTPVGGLQNLAQTQAASMVPAFILSGTAEQKADYYNFLRGQGFTDAQIRAGAGTQTDENWTYLTNLAAQRVGKTATDTRTDFSKLPPELRMAGQYAPLLAEQTKRPTLDQVIQRLDVGTQKFGPAEGTFEGLYEMPAQAAAPTAEEAFRNYIYAGGANDTLATTRGLQYARNLGLTPEQTTNLFNRSLGTSFGLADYDRVMAENAGLFPAMPQRPTTQVLPSPVMQQAPITGGLAFAQQQSGIGKDKYYENIAGALRAGIDPNRILTEMGTYGITTDDLIAAVAKYPKDTVQELGAVGFKPAITGGAGNDTVDTSNDQGGKAGGLVLYAGGPVMGSPQYFAEGGQPKTEYISLPDVEYGENKKYTPAELGSTFNIADYIDPETGRFMINEFRRDVIFNKNLEEAEKEARARMTPEIERMAMRDLMIRQGRTGKEYELPEITVGGPATGNIRPLNYYYAKGGLADIAMKGYAEELRQQGRNGDTILAHINPQEAAMLEAMGGSGTINPRTGLPEYWFSWKKLFKAASFILPFIPGIGLPARIALSGALAGASTPGKAFDFKRGIQAAIMTYAGGKLGEKIGTEFGGSVPASGTPSVDQNILGSVGSESAGQAATKIGEAGAVASNAATAAADRFANAYDAIPAYEAGISSPGQVLSNIGSNVKATVGNLTASIPSTVTENIDINPTSVGQAYGAYTSGVAADEAIKARQEADAILFAQEEKKKRARDVFRSSMGSIYGADGGLVAFADGGEIDPVAFVGGGMTAPMNQPRMLSGGGDGMSDSIPATIDGTQPARLADGEFVVPADVVADIGNGSSSAGAKRLYSMMDRVRTARHGTTKQPPEIKMNRLMPA